MLSQNDDVDRLHFRLYIIMRWSFGWERINWEFIHKITFILKEFYFCHISRANFKHKRYFDVKVSMKDHRLTDGWASSCNCACQIRLYVKIFTLISSNIKYSQTVSNCVISPENLFIPRHYLFIYSEFWLSKSNSKLILNLIRVKIQRIRALKILENSHHKLIIISIFSRWNLKFISRKNETFFSMRSTNFHWNYF